MIGLGSNRLTVCRRGGMAITQAGRGGMEWLAGGRDPIWASPYSAQATAALKDAFTAAQWATIQDYGVAHPALVPFINEDPMLVYSLINGLGKIRILEGDGNSCVTPNIYLQPSDVIRYKFWTPTSGYVQWSSHWGNNTSTVNKTCFVQDTGSNYDITLNSSRSTFTASRGAWHTLEIYQTYYLLDGVRTNKTSNQETLNQLINVFARVDSLDANGKPKAPTNYCYKGKMPFWEVEGRLYLVACEHDGGVGMLDIHDLEHPVFYPNIGSGSFTISETPAS